MSFEPGNEGDLIISADAYADLLDAAIWYETQQPGLGDVFTTAAEAIIKQIVRTPEIYAPVKGEVRRALVQRFPFSVYFKLESDRVVILAIIHASRHPDTWMRD